MAHGPIFFARNPHITCRKIQEICKIPQMLLIELRNLPIYLQILDRFSCSKSHLHFKTAFEKIVPYLLYVLFYHLPWKLSGRSVEHIEKKISGEDFWKVSRLNTGYIVHFSSCPFHYPFVEKLLECNRIWEHQNLTIRPRSVDFTAGEFFSGLFNAVRRLKKKI